MEKLPVTRNLFYKNGRTLLKLSVKRMFFPTLFSLIFTFFLLPKVNAQQLDVPYVPTPNAVVEAMLDAADVGPGDYVIDLGSGDGRIVIAAAKRGAFGHGIDLNPKRVEEARENALSAGVADRVLFMEGNIFDADFSRASVITMYLLNSVNLKLRPHLLKNLQPGSRVVSNDFDMNEWQPDKHINENNRDVFFWVIPANVDGEWSWNAGEGAFSMTVKQDFQKVRLNVSSGNSSLKVENSVFSGDRISFTAADSSNGNNYVYSGRVEGDNIIGTVQVRNKKHSSVENWTAKRQ